MTTQVVNGIWKYEDFLPRINKKYQISLGEGNTKLDKFDDIYFKHEYLNPTNSIKDRGFAYQISKAKESGIKNAVLSSSGNAAISASYYCRKAGINLFIFVSNKINQIKLKEIKKVNKNIIINPKPISQAIKFAKDKGYYNLRQSMDDNALYGYQTIAFELYRDNKDIDAVFTPVSSGTSFAGIANGFKKMGIEPAMHAVQTEYIHPIASIFDHAYVCQNTSLADAISAKYTPRKKEILDIIRKTSGFAWVISDVDLLTAKKWLQKRKILCSFEGALSLAGYFKSIKSGYRFKNPVCLLTGIDYSLKNV